MASVTNCQNTFEKLRFVPLRQFMLPDSHDLPTEFAECAGDQMISRLVGGDLLPPERGVVPRLDEVPRTAVPEAAVDENGQSELRKHEVRFH